MKKKVVILGCENSHAGTFLRFMSETPEQYEDIEVVGVYSEEIAAAEELNKTYGVPVMKTLDEMVGKVDGVIITARHGKNHYPYAKPYLASGVPTFIDKPITIEEDEAIAFMKEARANGVKITGGSCCKHDAFVQELKKDHAEDVGGKTVGGFVRAPLELSAVEYGGYHFYCQHLVEMVLEIYGRYPVAVKAYRSTPKAITVVFRYEAFEIIGLFVDEEFYYYLGRSAEKETKGKNVVLSSRVNPCFRIEFDEFCDILRGGKQHISYEDFIAPVFVQNAIARSLETGNEEAVPRFSL